ncbi:hypothetical protein L873DRAFT_1832686 [Choiromyces venosus 120613-1]|uniref:SGNH hydrolase-type esterase domain-containing protein n=1 Tax=Choiromyces venosus 120613-1 TaxID=1336337 RepID=A0A3N4K4I0_9PEZI|nr:hypothetical protein L873DRAFT_1832686 [Choiromyces venosus 120613-1]
MKLHARLGCLLGLLLVGCLVATCSTRIRIRYRRAIGLLPQQLIIFGDENSRIPSSNPFRQDSSSHHFSLIWTERLCKELLATCTSYTPLPPPPTIQLNATSGAVVDNLIFNSSWIKQEKENQNKERSTLFLALFGVNDIWKYSSFEKWDGVAAVEASLDSLFEQFGTVEEYWPDPPQTMLPGWGHLRSEDPRGEQLRNAVRLVKKWNRGLELRAKKWKKGRVFLWDMNKWFLDVVRSGREGGWKHVKTGCVESEESACDEPNKYLMWDDIRLGPQAQKKLATEIVRYLL